MLIIRDHDRETFRVSRELFDSVVVSKVYRFNGRRGRVVGKFEGVVPEINIQWLPPKAAKAA